MALILVFFAAFLSSGEIITPFGTVLGKNLNTIGYSNSNDSYTSSISNFVGNIYSGMQWQCVEYARRWLIQEKNLTFTSVDGAADIWSLSSLKNTVTGSKVSLTSIDNGSSCKPVPGNILIYKRGGSDIPYGHVAIITEVSETGVKVAEQNWDNDYWPGNYSRELAFTISEDKYYLIDVEYPINGWMEYPGTQSGCSSESSSYATKQVSLYIALGILMNF